MIFLTYLTCLCEIKGDEINLNLNTKALVAYHFIFPTIGVAVGIQPGDVLIFNPLIPHCCSHKLDFYYDKRVFLVSFYVKTGNVGGNNNNHPLTPIEEFILER